MDAGTPPPSSSRRRGARASRPGFLLGAALLALAGASATGGEPPSATPSSLDRPRREAIARGCAWISSKQHRDGGFGDDKAVVAITALSVLALMSDGSADGRGPHGEPIRKGIDFLLHLVESPQPNRPASEDGYFYYPNDFNSRMHGQGYATLALATALGTSTGPRSEQIRRVLVRAVACIERAQTSTGGFGYDPVPNRDHEGSVTVTVAQGLRAARDAGIRVSQQVILNGLHYLKRSQMTDPSSPFDGSFRYSLHHQRTSYALTAAALSSFFLYGRYDDDEERTIERGLKFLMGPRGLEAVLAEPDWWFYGHFYAAWTCWQRDGNEPDAEEAGYWARWHRRVFPLYLETQRADGSWEDPSDRFAFGPTLATAFAVLTLAIPDEAIPVFQR
jgi:hypothetical protein